MKEETKLIPQAPKYIVVRKACLMEDEGNPHYLRVFDSRKEAEDFVDVYTDNDTGYFPKICMMIIETEGP